MSSLIVPDSASMPVTLPASGYMPSPRRAFIFADEETVDSLRQRLDDAGYEALTTAAAEEASRLIIETRPDVVLIELLDEDEDAGLALARQLRSSPATAALPLALLYHEDERALRRAAANLGADDYLDFFTPTTELRARLAALLWRAEVRQRSAPASSDAYDHIGDFLFLSGAARAEISAGRSGVLALIEPVAREDEFNHETSARTLAETHGFLLLNLRRRDLLVFYGPTTLLVYLPEMDIEAATDALARLREELWAAQPRNEIAIGLASFPTDGTEIERLIEKAEVALVRARGARSRIVAYAMKDKPAAPVATAAAAPPPAPAQRERAQSESRRETLVERARRAEAAPTHLVREKRSFDAVEVSVASSLGLGRDGRAEAAERAAAQERDRRARGAIMPRRLLLTVSDPARMTQVNLLMRSAGYEVRAAFDGQQALNLLRIERPDLLLLDSELYGIDGVEVLRRLRQQTGGRLMLPVVMLAPERAGKARDEALMLGARDVIPLPYDPAQLLESVRLAGSVE